MIVVHSSSPLSLIWPLNEHVRGHNSHLNVVTTAPKGTSMAAVEQSLIFARTYSARRVYTRRLDFTVGRNVSGFSGVLLRCKPFPEPTIPTMNQQSTLRHSFTRICLCVPVAGMLASPAVAGDAQTASIRDGWGSAVAAGGSMRPRTPCDRGRGRRRHPPPPSGPGSESDGLGWWLSPWRRQPAGRRVDGRAAGPGAGPPPGGGPRTGCLDFRILESVGDGQG